MSRASNMVFKDQHKRILMIAPQPFFEPRGTPFSVFWRLKALSRLGYEVDLLTYPIGRDVAIPGLRIVRISSIRFIRQVRVGPSWSKFLLDIFLFIKAIRLLRQGRYDLLHTHEEASHFGVLLAKLFRIRHLYDMHSSLPQQLCNFEFTRFRPLIRLFEWLENRAIRSSDAIISICPALEEHVNKLNGHGRHVLIENVASEEDPTTVSEEDVRKFETTHSLGGKTIVLYPGSFEPYQGIDLLIASAAWVLKRRRDVVFLLMGGKPNQVQYYQKQVNEFGLAANFRLIGSRPPAEVPLAVRLAHVLVSPRINGTNTPLKIYSYLQSGKPIVATNTSTHTQVLNSDAAVLVDAEPCAFARGILSVLEDPSLADRLSASARQLFDSRYSYQQFLAKTDHVMRIAVGTPNVRN
jgi:glycosyltransferase involved in cell wall biosynthesis